MRAKFDHLVIYVSNLEEAITDFTDLGFEVSRGGAHGATENALIIFSNQVYIELLAWVPVWYTPLLRTVNRLGILQWLADRKGTIYCRLLNWVTGPQGPVDWCVRVDDLAAQLGSWKNAEMNVLKSEQFSRKRVDGQILRWYLGGTRSFDLPFMLEDITPIDMRIPPLTEGAHPNGALALEQIQFRVNNKATSNALAAEFLSPEFFAQDKQTTTFGMGAVKVSFEQRPMPCKVSLTVSCSGSQTHPLDIGKSHGIQIELVPSNLNT